MTDGEQWTAGLALLVSVLFLSSGLQQPVKDTSIRLGLPRPTGSLAAPADPGTAPVTVPPVVLQPAALPEPPAVPVTVPQDTTPAVAPVVVSRAEPSPTSVVALVRPATSTVDDGAVAKVFLPQIGARVKVLSVDPANTSLCAETAAAGNLVVASQGLPAALRGCLLGKGATLVSYDELGFIGRSVSTRLRASTALVQAAKQVAPGQVLGLAVRTDLAGEARAAQSLLKRQGRKVVVALIPGGSTSPPDYLTALQAFSAAGVQTVVFGMPQADQSTWATLEVAALFRPAHVVADVADAFLSEGYLATFDGTVGVAATRVPWFERDHQATTAQAACRSRYEKATSTTISGTAQLADVYLWCQHAQILRSALARGGDVATAVRALVVDAPMTSSLTSGQDGYGPSRVAVLTWGTTCGCWSEKSPFRAMS